MQLFKGILVLSVLVATFTVSSVLVSAQSNKVDELKEKIGDRTSKIRSLEKEIERYEVELDGVGKEKSTLQSTIKTLDLSQGKLKAELDITSNRVSATNFQISKLILETSEKQRQIALHTDTLAQNLRTINKIDENTFVESFLASESISDYWKQIEDIQQFQTTLQRNLSELVTLRDALQVNRSEQELRRKELLEYDRELSEQEKAVEINKREKSSLLTQTKNKESSYIQILEDKKAARAEFEQELLDFESQLNIAIDPDSLPLARQGVLAWPLDKVRVTQKFGNTDFAKGGAYNGKGHNGIDMAASLGTRIKAPLSGIVLATGNTDAIKGCYSYGKWMLIKHNNGLSTLYGHLSDIALKQGTSVTKGETIGYSGNTGYSTGPHLHFSVFASQGVKIVRFGDIKAVTNCANASIPVAPHEAYLDPLLYLDSI